MAKIPFSKLQASVSSGTTILYYNNKAGDRVCYEVKHYLPFNEKLALIERVINQSIDDNGFYNPMRVKLFMVLEVVYSYTNLNFTEKMKEDPFKLYDILVSTGIFDNIIECIGEKDWSEVRDTIWATINSIYTYKNSVMGILDTVARDYENLNLDAGSIQQKLADPENMELLRNILTKLG